MQPPLIFAFPYEFFKYNFNGYVFGVKEPNHDDFIYLFISLTSKL